MKSLTHLSEDEQERVVNGLVDEMVVSNSTERRQEDRSATESSTQNDEPPPSKKCALEVLLGDSFFSDTDPTSDSTGVNVSMTELVMIEVSQYKALPVLPLNQKPLHWWREHASYYPKLASMAQKYLAIVATSVPSERLFSVAGMVVNAKRGSLDPENTKMPVFLHDNTPDIHVPYKRIMNHCTCLQCNNNLC